MAITENSGMRYQFRRRDDGSVHMILDDDLPLLRDALEASLGTRPPRGGPQGGRSTNWLDNAITRLRERMGSGSAEPFASGNVTYLLLRGSRVEARYDFEPVDSDIVDRVESEDLLGLLTEWRRLVLEASPEAAHRMPPPRPARPMPPPA